MLPVPRLRATVRRVRTAATMPMGTLTKKIERQPRVVVRTPPRRTPAAMPMLPMVPQMARAVERCLPV